MLDILFAEDKDRNYIKDPSLYRQDSSQVAAV
jgi:hypothetical protein